MSAIWKINGIPIGDLDVDSLIINLNNMDDDYAEIRMPRNFDAATPEMFQSGAPVVITWECAGTQKIVFRGTMDDPMYSAGVAQEAHPAQQRALARGADEQRQPAAGAGLRLPGRGFPRGARCAADTR